VRFVLFSAGVYAAYAEALDEIAERIAGGS